jgi:DNA-binding winged helix-turn-helix (wHTH) protein/pimeloyl-ACP methyl ester carboxylesterase
VQFLFDDHVLDVERRELRRAGERIAMEPQVFDLLVHLVRNRDRVLSKDDLIEAIWDGRVVSESTLTSRINAVRKAVGDSGKAQRLIRTVQRKGIRFIGEVSEAFAPRGAAVAAKAEPPQTPALRHEIQFCTASDGVRIAYAEVGTGPPLLKAANWLNHLEHDWESPIWSHLLRELAAEHRLIRYDARGNGLSDWEVDDISFDAFARDLESVVEATGIDRFALLGISQGCAVSIAYAVRHPQRVSHLVLYGGFARGRRKRGSPEEVEQADALLTLMRQGWGQENPAFRQIFTSLFIPGATAEQGQWFNDLQQKTTSPANAVRIRRAVDDRSPPPRHRADAGAALPQRRGAAVRGRAHARRRHPRRALRRARRAQSYDPRGRPGVAAVSRRGQDLPAALTVGEPGVASGAGAVDYFPQVGDMLSERAATGRAHSHAGLRLAVLEALFHHDVASLFERLEVGTEIAVGCSKERLETGELDRCPSRRERVECGHDLQPHGLVDDFVAAAHCGMPLLPSQTPPRMSVPLCTATIQSRNQGSAWR